MKNVETFTSDVFKMQLLFNQHKLSLLRHFYTKTNLTVVTFKSRKLKAANSKKSSSRPCSSSSSLTSYLTSLVLQSLRRDRGSKSINDQIKFMYKKCSQIYKRESRQEISNFSTNNNLPLS